MNVLTGEERAQATRSASAEPTIHEPATSGEVRSEKSRPPSILSTMATMPPMRGQTGPISSFNDATSGDVLGLSDRRLHDVVGERFVVIMEGPDDPRDPQNWP